MKEFNNKKKIKDIIYVLNSNIDLFDLSCAGEDKKVLDILEKYLNTTICRDELILAVNTIISNKQLKKSYPDFDTWLGDYLGFLLGIITILTLLFFLLFFGAYELTLN